MVTPELFITNQHVIADATAASAAQVTFDREMGANGAMRAVSVFKLAPERFALFSKQEELDYALVALGPRVSGEAVPVELGYCVLSDQPDKHVIGMNVNIVQHPNGLPKMIAIRNNILQHRTDRTLLYETDTDHGSSGAAVFNDSWELVALHHFGEPFLERTDENGKAIPTTVNEGVRISAIYRDLVRLLNGLDGEQRRLLATALELSKTVLAETGGRSLSPPRPSQDAQESWTSGSSSNDQQEGASMSTSDGGQEIKVTIPIEVSIRVGGAAAAAGLATAAVPAVLPKTLTRSAEKIAIDVDYSNRHGYKANFVHGVDFPLPVPTGKLAKQVAPLRPTEADAESGELKYEHFSIKMNKSKKVALFTATNIDGNTYLNIDRGTGQVKDAAEGETWYSDPRISASFFIDQTFYSGWSNLFDRGHLTRRTDPTWGSEEEAERANADTYHFTNCSPQHFRFNESTKYWQGLERYILENGAVAEDSSNRICVFQGPIYDDKVDLWADDIQIPSTFFKVVAWKGKGGVKSVGLVVDQRQLLNEQRKGGIKPPPIAFVNISQWRVAITEIEKRTNLDFGKTVRTADTFENEDQPVVGEGLPAIPVKSEGDLLPKNF
jgi:endonuclease G